MRIALDKRWIWIGLTTLAAATAAIGWMHTPDGLRLLVRLGVPCPVDRATPDQVAAVRERGLIAVRGTTPAPVRPALGLALDRTTLAQAQQWVAGRGMQCDAVTKGLNFLRCRGVDAHALAIAGPPISEMWLSFGRSGTLVGVDVYRRGLDARDAAVAWTDATRRLQGELGAPSSSFGDASPTALTSSLLRTARVQYRYSDYIATVTAANLPRVGLAVREQYLSARSEPSSGT